LNSQFKKKYCTTLECQFLGAGSIRSSILRWVDRNWSKQKTSYGPYLDWNVRTQEGLDKDVERRIGLARGTWQALGKMWSSKDLTLKEKQNKDLHAYGGSRELQEETR